MKWVEMIRVQSSKERVAALAAPLQVRVRDLSQAAGIEEVVVLQHALHDGSLAILLVWNDGRVPLKTREGLLTSDWLQEFGAVDHAVWVLAPGFPAPARPVMERIHGQAGAGQ